MFFILNFPEKTNELCYLPLQYLPKHLSLNIPKQIVKISAISRSVFNYRDVRKFASRLSNSEF